MNPALSKIEIIQMKKIEHIGIAVKNLEDSIAVFEQILNTNCYKTESVDSEQVNTAFFSSGPNKIELLEPQSEESVIHKFIETKGEGIHHIAFEVENIEKEMQRLVNAGFTLLNDKPKQGADGKLVCFLHPKKTNGVLIELVMDYKAK